MPIALIAAVSGPKRVIGNQDAMPWHFPADMKHFKETTMGHPVLMGRKTFDAIIAMLGHPLTGRPNLVVTRDQNYKPAHTQVFHDIDSALRSVAPHEWLFVIGGQQIYEQTIGKADRLNITHIDKEYAGDAFFPAIDRNIWKLSRETLRESEGVKLRFCVYVRQTSA